MLLLICQEEEELQVTRKKDDGQVDVINCNNPVELISALLRKMGGAASMDQLCQVRTRNWTLDGSRSR